MNKIRTGDIIYTSSWEFVSNAIRWGSGSVTNHNGIAIWVKQDQLSGRGVIPTSIVPGYTPGYKLMIAEISFVYRLTRFETIFKRDYRCYYRKLKTKYTGEEVCRKLLEFIKESKFLTVEHFKPGLKTLNFVFKWNQGKDCWPESCVSWTLTWLEKMGYSYDHPLVPHLPRKLHTSDHLFPKFNRHPILGKRLIPILEQTKPYSENEIVLFSWFFILVVALFILGLILAIEETWFPIYAYQN